MTTNAAARSPRPTAPDRILRPRLAKTREILCALTELLESQWEDLRRLAIGHPHASRGLLTWKARHVSYLGQHVPYAVDGANEALEVLVARDLLPPDAAPNAARVFGEARCRFCRQLPTPWLPVYADGHPDDCRSCSGNNLPRRDPSSVAACAALAASYADMLTAETLAREVATRFGAEPSDAPVRWIFLDREAQQSWLNWYHDVSPPDWVFQHLRYERGRRSASGFSAPPAIAEDAWRCAWWPDDAGPNPFAPLMDLWSLGFGLHQWRTASNKTRIVLMAPEIAS